jgi:hypothetical protein
MAKTWSGSFGEGGLRAVPHEIKTDVRLQDDTFDVVSRIDGRVLTGRGGDRAGDFTRTAQLHENGWLEIHHDYLSLGQQYQGTGFARAFNDRAFERYAKAGVHDVTIYAALSVGGYAWARQGFELLASGASAAEKAGSRATRIARMVDEAHVEGRISKREYERLQPRLLRPGSTMQRDTLTSVQELAAIPEIGRKALLGASWDGARHIDATKPWWTTSRAAKSQAHEGTVQLRGAGTMEESQAAHAALGASIREALPPALEPSRVNAAFTQALAGAGELTPSYRSGATQLRFNAQRDLLDLSHNAPYRLNGEEFSVSTRVSGDGAAVTGRVRSRDRMSPEIERAIGTAWESLGVTSRERQVTNPFRG